MLLQNRIVGDHAQQTESLKPKVRRIDFRPFQMSGFNFCPFLF